jgi:hypothetical protein
VRNAASLYQELFYPIWLILHSKIGCSRFPKTGQKAYIQTVPTITRTINTVNEPARKPSITNYMHMSNETFYKMIQNLIKPSN